MDGLDTYIDDYGKPDPIPLSMLRQMNQAAVLGPVRRRRPMPREGAAAARGISRWCRPLPTVAQSSQPAPCLLPLNPAPMTTLICDCNQTMPLDGPALAPGPRA